MWERALKIGLSSTGFIGYVGFGLLSLALNIGLSTGFVPVVLAILVSVYYLWLQITVLSHRFRTIDTYIPR